MTEDDIFGLAKQYRETRDEAPEPEEATCRTCLSPGFHPPHMPSLHCEHNGTIAHCTCARCW